VKELRDRVAVVTGAASGIGLALTERFAAEGMKVVMADIEGPALASAAEALRRTAPAVRATQVDVSRSDEAASPVLERACSVAREANLTLLRPQATRLLGGAYLLAGRIDEGVTLVRAAANEVESRRLLMQQAAVLALLGEARLFASRLEEASTVGHRALTLARDGSQRGDEAIALRVLGDIVTHSDQSDAKSGQAHYRHALELAEPLGMRPLIAHCHLGLGKLYRRTGKREQAQEHLTTATTMYREMGMTYWLEQAEAELNMLR
jgi:NAD(P)-dependent dehydrogenase (short-subunit alcohol dehydrogenase family)